MRLFRSSTEAKAESSRKTFAPYQSYNFVTHGFIHFARRASVNKDDKGGFCRRLISQQFLNLIAMNANGSHHDHSRKKTLCSFPALPLVLSGPSECARHLTRQPVTLLMRNDWTVPAGKHLELTTADGVIYRDNFPRCWPWSYAGEL